MFKTLLKHPLARGLEIDAPETTILHRRIIQKKPFLKKIYQEWYAWLVATLPENPPGAVVELGVGGGFLNEFIPHLITSEVFYTPSINAAFDAQQLPFVNASLKGIMMTNVFHHLPRPRTFFADAARCVRPGGVIAMIEPWVTPWSRMFYEHFHHEPFDPNAQDWEFQTEGRLSGANDALAWIIFQRDRARFEREFPQWEIQTIHPCMPFCYLLSGGVSMRSLMPGWSFQFWKWLETRLRPRMEHWAMFVQIVLVRREDRAARPKAES